jgi:hypothetical protein
MASSSTSHPESSAMTHSLARLASIALFNILAGFSAHAQVVEAWSKRFDSSVWYDLPTDLVADAQGKVTVVGTAQTSAPSFPSPQATTRAFAVRYDALGTLQWSSFYSAAAQRRTSFAAAAAAPLDGIVACGTTESTQGTPVQDVVVVSFDASGNILWSANYDTPGGGSELGYDVVVEPTGDVWVAGQVTVSGGTPDWLVLKYAANGALLWASTWNGSGNLTDTALAIALDGQGGAYVTGSAGTPHGHQQVGLARFDGSGNLLWAREYAGTGPGASFASHVVVDAAGDAYLSGQTRQGTLDVFTLMKYDSSGAQRWVSAPLDYFTNFFPGRARRAIVDEAGYIVVTGTFAIAPGDDDIVLEKYDSAGNLVWERAWGLSPQRDDIATQIAFDLSGEIFVAGTTTDAGSSTPVQALLLRFDPDGTERWEDIWGDPTFDEAVNGLAIGPTGAVFATTLTQGSHGGGDADVLTKRFDSTSLPFCFGDGTGTACPCGNASPVGDRSGCNGSLGYAGKLADGGGSSLSLDGLALFAYGMPLTTSMLFFQGDAAVANGAGAVFGDGLRCAGGSIVRLATKTAYYGGAIYPQGNEPSVSVRGNVTSPGRRTYQVWYRNAASFCTSDTFNLTNGLRVTWTL